MFERYVEKGRRAIYFAMLTAVFEKSLIGSEQLLVGLFCDADSRANTLFRLRELLPERFAVLAMLKPVHPTNYAALTDEGKRVLAYTAMEARRLKDYWIDTEHLLLGILNEQQSAAAMRLKKAGIELQMARQIVMMNKPSRPNYGPAPRLWKLKAFFGR